MTGSGFNGDRLRSARIGRGLSTVTLGQLIGSPGTAIASWECGYWEPDNEALARLAGALNHPELFFFQAPAVERPDRINLRSRSVIGKVARARLIERLCFLQEIGIWVQETLKFPDVDLPGHFGPDHRDLTPRIIENAARDCRNLWGLAGRPIQDMIVMLECAGFVTAFEEFSCPTLDSISAWSRGDGRPYVLLSRDRNSVARTRFEAAYQLGHIVLHSHVDAERIGSPHGHLEISRQAALFAGAFLMPADSFIGDLPSVTLGNLLALKERWGVAVDAMIRRCEALGMLTGGLRYNLWKQYSAKGWGGEEPLEKRLRPEEPELLARSFRMVLEDGIYDGGQIARRLALSASDIESLANLPPGYISGAPAEILVFPRVRKQRRKLRPGESTVVQFPGPIRQFH